MMNNLTPELKLLCWLMEHTSINNNIRVTTSTLKQKFLKNNREIKEEQFKNITLLIGMFLKMIYKNSLIKYKITSGGVKQTSYNIQVYNKPVKEFIIQEYPNLYNIKYMDNKKYFQNNQEVYSTVNKFFNDYTLKPSQINKLDNLRNELILFCLSKGIPKRYLKYFFCYTMGFINKNNIQIIGSIEKIKFKKNKVCAICGCQDNLTVHHIKPICKAPYLEFNINNLLVLCNECHKKHHQKQDLLLYGGGK